MKQLKNVHSLSGRTFSFKSHYFLSSVLVADEAAGAEESDDEHPLTTKAAISAATKIILIFIFL